MNTIVGASLCCGSELMLAINHSGYLGACKFRDADSPIASKGSLPQKYQTFGESH